MPEWKISSKPIPFPDALAFMQARVESIADDAADETIWLLEHPPMYTSGTSAKKEDLIDARFDVFETGRGGEYTYHGPGQSVGYVMLNLKKRYAPNVPDVRDFVSRLQRWIITSLGDFGIEGFVREGRVGVWVMDKTGKECKIAAQGIRISRGISYHGIAVNVAPDLSHYSGIVPCGISSYGVTSMKELGVNISLPEFDGALQKHFITVFG